MEEKLEFPRSYHVSIALTKSSDICSGTTTITSSNTYRTTTTSPITNETTTTTTTSPKTNETTTTSPKTNGTTKTHYDFVLLSVVFLFSWAYHKK